VPAGVLSALGALVAAALLDAAVRRWRHHAAQEELLRYFDPPNALEPEVGDEAGELAGLQVALYLRPEKQVVRYLAGWELGELRSWCTAPGRTRVRLVTGDGGAGKTRLALQLGQDLSGHGWRALWVKDGREGQAAGLMRGLKQPCLLVVDYAENRQQLPELLAAFAENWDGPRVRVVLLARGAEDWWKKLVRSRDARLARLLRAAAAPVTVGPMTTGMAELFGEAVTAFAERLHLHRPDVQWTMADPAPTMLVVQAAALLAVLGHARTGRVADTTQTPAANGQDPGSAEEVLDEVLEHEARYWEQSAKNRELHLPERVQRLAVAAGCLIGADSAAAAGRLMQRIPDLADNALLRGNVASWLRDLYPQARAGPPAKAEWIGPLRPDPVAERHVVRVLTDDLELIPGWFTGLDEHRAAKALTVLARAALTQPRAKDLLSRALAADLEHLAVPAMSVAVETNDILGELLADALEARQVSAATLTQIADNAPSPSVAVARAAAVALWRLADQSTGSERARRLADRGGRLSELKKPEEALDAIEEAVGIYASLADEDPGVLRNLASSLNSQSMRLAELGHYQEALDVIEKAVEIRRSLADDDPDAQRHLAGALQTRSHRLADLGRRTEALPPINEAAGIYQQLAATSPAYEASLASALNSQSMRLADLERHKEALEAINRAIVIYQELAGTRPDAYRHTLAGALRTQSHRLAELGKRTEALQVIDEAVEAYRRLAEDHPDAFRSTLADAQRTRSDRLADLGRRTEALDMINQAVETYRTLAQDHPGAFRPALADALDTQSWRLADLGRRTDALPPIDEAVRIYRELTDSSTDFRPRLANALNSQSIRRAELGRHEEALAAIEDTVGIYRELAENRPDAFGPEVAKSLNIESMRLADLKRYPEALAAIEEAAVIYRGLEVKDPGAFRPDLAGVLHTQSHRLAEVGRHTDALSAVEEAIGIYRELAEDRPDAFRPALADALHTKSYRLAELGQKSEALDAIEETVELYESLRTDFPGAFEPRLASALNSQAMHLANVRGHEREALAAAEEAVEICRSLEAEFPGAFRPELADVLHTWSWRLAELGQRQEALAAIDETVEIYRSLNDSLGIFELRLANALNSQSIRLADRG
jgi:tetratricopeptide (TPR) repeat protein